MDTLHVKDEFEKSAKLWADAINNGDHRTANKLYKKLRKQIDVLGKDRELAENILNSLIEDPTISVRYWASIGFLYLQINIGRGEVTLSRIANDLNSGPVGAMAKISLSEWKKGEKA